MNPVWLLMCAIGIVGANSLVLSPIAGDVASSLDGASGPDVLIASAAYGAGTALSALILAPRADVFGLRRSLVLALLLLGIALGLSAAALSLPMLVVAQTLAGIAAGTALPATYGLAADLAPKGRESETLGKVLTGWTLSLVAGVSLSALLADLLHWRAVFGLLATMGIALAWAVYGSVASRPDRRTKTATSPLVALRLPGILPLLMSVVAYMVAFYGLYAYLGTHLTVTLGLSTAMAGLAAVSYGLGFGLVAPLDRLIDRFGAARAAPVIFALLMGAYVLLALGAGSALAVLGLCFLWGAANHLGLNILVGQLTSLDPARRGAIMGLYSAVTYGAMFLGTAGFRPLYEHHGFAMTSATAALCILPALLSSLGHRRHASLSQ